MFRQGLQPMANLHSQYQHHRVLNCGEKNVLTGAPTHGHFLKLKPASPGFELSGLGLRLGHRVNGTPPLCAPLSTLPAGDSHPTLPACPKDLVKKFSRVAKKTNTKKKFKKGKKMFRQGLQPMATLHIRNQHHRVLNCGRKKCFDRGSNPWPLFKVKTSITGF